MSAMTIYIQTAIKTLNMSALASMNGCHTCLHKYNYIIQFQLKTKSNTTQ